MENNLIRLFVEKKPSYAVEAKSLLKDLKYNAKIKGLTAVRVINRYDISGISEREFEVVRKYILSEVAVDCSYDDLSMDEGDIAFAYEYLPGQYDVRADSSLQCIQLLLNIDEVKINTAKVIVLKGTISKEEFDKVKNYCINSIDSREAEMSKPNFLMEKIQVNNEVDILEGFIDLSEDELNKLRVKYGFAMTIEDLSFAQDYFKNDEKRNPSITELKVIDTYWSDHCRHTTFMTNIQNIRIEKSKFTEPIKDAFHGYLDSRANVYKDKVKPVCLMDIATIAMKEMRQKGLLEDLEVSREINACSIEVDVDVEGKIEKWLLMFKNETHNHPTEIEPFGGAATCLGGAIRDPLSGRAYVYQAMRITGSGDPRAKIEATIKGKLPQRKIAIGAAEGYSSYGNQIGLATGQVVEHYDEGFIAKRMEVGAVIGAVPKQNVRRDSPEPSDVVILLGGRTGRDGCGGATGSSKEHDEASIISCGAEVQKGNPVVERKLQRLFRNPEAAKLIKCCNDFGAGGVAVAIGELAEGLLINLNLIPKKYEGLDGTELAISESQERMAVVTAKEDAEDFISLAKEENLEAVVVARVTEEKRLKMLWKGKHIVDIARSFLDTNGAKQNIDVTVQAPLEEKNYFNNYNYDIKNLKGDWLNNLKDLNICLQKGLGERFDSTIGAATVLMPYGGKYQVTPAEGMAAKLPVLKGDTKTVSLMSFGYNSKIGKWSPFHGAVYAIIEALAKITTLGGDYKKARLSLQEYFERLGKDPAKWGKPFSALLGALYVQKELMVPAIGGKDSMSGSFKELNVPPTVVAFAVCLSEVNSVLSPEFKKAGSKVVLLKAERDNKELPVFNKLKNNFEKVIELNKKGKILSAISVRAGGISEAISKMSFGNKIGFVFSKSISTNTLLCPDYGSMILELNSEVNINELLKGTDYEELGCTTLEEKIRIGEEIISLNEALESYTSPLEEVFPTKVHEDKEVLHNICFERSFNKSPIIKVPKPKVFIPVFPGTNCEYDSQRAFEKAGGEVQSFVFRNLNHKDIEEAIDNMVKYIDASQIMMLPGGFSAGDEPDGSGKFITAILRNERINEAVMRLLHERDGLMLGICNGFQALIKHGLVPYGDIRELSENSPTLTHNSIGRHVSCMVRTKVVSKLSPWFSNAAIGEIHTLPVSHGEGRFVCSEEEIKRLINNGQVASQYVDFEGNATYDIKHNPNGSYYAVEAITSPDGRILGKMAHSERRGNGLYKNIPEINEQKIFEAGVSYFK
ncbi:phosphoribosylformylglycinamidine synthase [Candidatus Clostridium stratigraminis]|uniref:Phosphoribosylformylglycinamidine synthase n=1 Tax=Candidatus Clostridium stratigraminis TaxID=3381661 RepID=A0ABW8T1B0_9CLOT